MISRITEKFQATRKTSSRLLVPFITASYPKLNSTVGLLNACADAGAQIIELGIPFSDPSADGPSIQRSSFNALQNGQNLKLTLNQIKAFRKNNKQAALVLMGYTNSFMAFGIKQFAQQAKTAGVDGLICVDLSDEMFSIWHKILKQNDISLIPLIAPTSPPEQIKKIVAYIDSFAYVISSKATTGKNTQSFAALNDTIKNICAFGDFNLAIGFGIRTSKQVQNLPHQAQAAVVGSALIELLEANQEFSEKILQEQTSIFLSSMIENSK